MRSDSGEVLREPSGYGVLLTRYRDESKGAGIDPVVRMPGTGNRAYHWFRMLPLRPCGEFSMPY